MESDIKVKANRKEMDDAFEHSDIFSIRRFIELKHGLFEVKVRHKQLENYLEGTYTIPQLEQILKD